MHQSCDYLQAFIGKKCTVVTSIWGYLAFTGILLECANGWIKLRTKANSTELIGIDRVCKITIQE